MKFLRSLVAAAALILMPATLVAACESTPRLTVPISADYSFEQNAYAALKAYEVVATEVADIVEDPATPPTAKTILATASLNVEPLAQAAIKGLSAYSEVQGKIKARIDAGQDVPEALLNEAGVAYARAKELWAAAQKLVTEFPGLVEAVKAGQ